MAKTQGASAPKRVTAQHPFFSCRPDGARLFSVCADIPLSDALENASTFLAAAKAAVYQVAADEESDMAFGAAYLIEMSEAIVEAALDIAGGE